MDVNRDGVLDILSGSYSRHSKDMAGLFQVLYGQKSGGYAVAVPLCGVDDEPLIITMTADDGSDHVTDKICTRPFACDLNGDGKLDIVSGNFSGTFALFLGEEKGFATTSTWLLHDGEPLRVDAHSDPFLVDWDGDGDLDLLSGSAQGGAFLFANEGSKTSPAFGAKVTLLEPVGHDAGNGGPHWGDGDLTGPQASTRIWVDDLDGDGKLDLLIGDGVSLCFPAEGVTEADAKQQLAAWEKRQQEVFESIQPADGKTPTEDDQQKFQTAYEALQEQRAKFVRDEHTGFVWFLRRK